MEQAVLVAPDSTNDKAAIADAFIRAAKSYDQHAEFQRDVGLR